LWRENHIWYGDLWRENHIWYGDLWRENMDSILVSDEGGGWARIGAQIAET